MVDLSDKDMSHVNHAIKNALASLSAYVQLLKRASDNGDEEKIRDITHKLERQSETVTNMVITVGEWIRLTRQPEPPMEESYDLGNVLTLLVGKYRRIYPEVPITFESVHTTCVGDQEKTSLAMARILELFITQHQEGSMIGLEVISTPSDCQVHITSNALPENMPLTTFFEPLGIQSAHGNQQTGLEMTLVKAWIEGQGGKIAVLKQQGITLAVTLPRKSAHT
jgi:light-regulated signal transduction histidine kinase (bacteriophytochrome)